MTTIADLSALDEIEAPEPLTEADWQRYQEALITLQSTDTAIRIGLAHARAGRTLENIGDRIAAGEYPLTRAEAYRALIGAMAYETILELGDRLYEEGLLDEDPHTEMCQILEAERLYSETILATGNLHVTRGEHLCGSVMETGYPPELVNPAQLLLHLRERPEYREIHNNGVERLIVEGWVAHQRAVGAESDLIDLGVRDDAIRAELAAESEG